MKKNLLKKVWSIILSVVMVISVIPNFSNVQIVNAASVHAYDVDMAIEFAKTHCANDRRMHPNTTGGTTACSNKWLCAEFVYNCIKYGGYKCTGKYNMKVPYTLGQDLIASGATKIYCKKRVNEAVYMSDFSEKLQKGDVIIILYTNHPSGGSGQGHAVIYSGDVNSKGKVKVYAHNSRKQNEVLVTSPKTCSIYALHMNGKKITYSVSLNSPVTTNTTALIGATLNTTAKVQKWGYDIGTSKTSLNEWKKVNDWGDNGKSNKSLSVTISKYKNSNLMPNKTYYYQLSVKIAGKWYKSSVSSFKTKNVLPSQSTLSIAATYSDIGIGDTATVTWKKVSNADDYKIRVYNSSNILVYSKNRIQGTSCTIPSADINKVGKYTVKLYAHNAVGDKEASNTKTFTVHNNVIVTFYDTISKEVISREDIPYGHTATAPASPVQTGHTFTKWDKDYSKVKSDITVNTVYEANEYAVKFIDGINGKQIGKTQKVRYGNAATPPSKNELDIPAGYEFVGWDVDCNKIETNTIVTANYRWYNKNYPVSTKIDSVIRNTNKDGYDVKVTVTNGKDEVIQGRVVVALQSKDGLMYTTSESSAFSLAEASSTGDKAKTVKVFVPFSNLGYKVSVYTLNNYEKAATIAKPLTQEIDNSSTWTPWIEYTDNVPVTKGVNGVSEVETKSDTPKVTQYSYRTKSTTTSYATSLSDYTQDGGTWVSQGQTTLDYGVKWPGGFDTGNALYKKYHKAKKTASENTTTKVVINSDTRKSYIYWHWCRGASVGAINRGIEWNETSTYSKFHAFESSTKKAYNTSANAYKWQRTSDCKDTYWWNGYATKKDGLVTVNTQKYTTYKKLFNYYKWSDWSPWNETPVTAISGSKEVKTQTVAGKTTKYYRYKTDSKVEEPKLENDKQLVDISGKVNPKFAGKNVTVYVYKYTQASDYTTEYMGNTTVGTDGKISIAGAKLREATSVETGNFKIIASIEGNTESIEIGTIEAPKPTYTVTFQDYNGKVLKVVKDVVEGDTVTAPTYTDKELGIPEGYEFTTWDVSTVNVNADMIVRPQAKVKRYVVVYVDWANQDVQFEELDYGDEINPPEAEKKEGYMVAWDMSDATKVTESLGDGSTTDKYIVTKNTVITTKYEEEVYKVSFVSTDYKEPCVDYYELEGETIEELTDSAEISSVKNVVYEDRVDIPENDISENEDYLFYGWRNIDTGEYLTDTQIEENGTYYPVYEFANTAEAPVANVKTGEYTEEKTVTLSCDIADAIIYYTTDGTDPATSTTAVEYNSPIKLSKSTVLKFCAVAMGMNNSGTVIELYAINTKTSGTPYHIVTIYSDIAEQEGECYQTMLRDSTLLNISELKNVEGYKFSELYYDENHTDEFDENSELVTETLNLFVHYTPNIYTVKFFDESDNLISEQKIEYGGSAQEPTPNKKAGYVFAGWDNDEYEAVTENVNCKAIYVPENQYATVSLNKSNVTMMEGMQYSKLVAQISPEELLETELTWTSSNPDIVTVDAEGVVHAQSAGEATVTVTVDSTGESASCTFKVVGNYQTSIVLNEKSKLGIDSEGYLREIKPDRNTVEEVLSEFNNETENLKAYDRYGKELTDDSLVGTGTVIKLMSGGEELDSMTVVMTGDIDGDGHLGNTDVSRLSRWLIQTEELTYEQQLASDVNGDGSVNNKDASMISRYLVGKENL